MLLVAGEGCDNLLAEPSELEVPTVPTSLEGICLFSEF